MSADQHSESSAVVLLSGGMDSVAVLHHVTRQLRCESVYAVSFDYGQRHAKELTCARYQATAASVTEHRVLNVSFLADVFADATALVSGSLDVPNLDSLSPDQRDQPPTYVPNRNMILLSLAAAFAEARLCRDVFYGAQAQDEYGYWDCTSEFVARLNQTLALNRREPVTIHAPFISMRKAETLRLGLELGVDYSQTWSCYRGGDKACGVCPTCVERLNAFDEVGLADPIPYEATRRK